MAVGDNENQINIYDLRNQNIQMHKLLGHKAAVKAIAWSPINFNILISAGGLNDNKIK